MQLAEYVELPEVCSEKASYELDEGELVPMSPTAKDTANGGGAKEI